MADALIKQLNLEYESAYAYKALQAYCSSIDMPGAASWFSQQAEEEQLHAARVFTYLLDQDRLPEFPAIAAASTDCSSLLGVFQTSLEHEQKVTKSIHNLVDIAVEEKDHATNAFLQWFVTEQVEEEATVREIIERLKLAGDSPQALLLIDSELANRPKGSD